MNTLELFAVVAFGVDYRKFEQPLAPFCECDACDTNCDVYIVGSRDDFAVGNTLEKGVERGLGHWRQFVLLGLAGDAARRWAGVEMLGRDNRGGDRVVVLVATEFKTFELVFGNYPFGLIIA